VDKSWEEVLAPHKKQIESILDEIKDQEFLPDAESIFRALSIPVDQVRVVILGQDPYPTPGMAEGLAFSVPKSITKLPPSLKNIFHEYASDLSLPAPLHGHLGAWVEQGVLLLNRILTVLPGAPLSHSKLGWEAVTDSILQVLSQKKVPIICWGKPAQEAAIEAGFSAESIFASPHPSPLSAYRGFFGSRPFTRVNEYRERMGLEPIDWKLSS